MRVTLCTAQVPVKAGLTLGDQPHHFGGEVAGGAKDFRHSLTRPVAAVGIFGVRAGPARDLQAHTRTTSVCHMLNIVSHDMSKALRVARAWRSE